MLCIWEGFQWLSMSLGYLAPLSLQHLKQSWGALVKLCLNSVSTVISNYWVNGRARRANRMPWPRAKYFSCSPISLTKQAFHDMTTYSLKWYYDENRICPIEAILKHRQVVCEEVKGCLLFSNTSFYSRDIQVFKICTSALIWST